VFSLFEGSLRAALSLIVTCLLRLTRPRPHISRLRLLLLRSGSRVVQILGRHRRPLSAPRIDCLFGCLKLGTRSSRVFILLPHYCGVEHAGDHINVGRHHFTLIPLLTQNLDSILQFRMRRLLIHRAEVSNHEVGERE